MHFMPAGVACTGLVFKAQDKEFVSCVKDNVSRTW